MYQFVKREEEEKSINRTRETEAKMQANARLSNAIELEQYRR